MPFSDPPACTAPSPVPPQVQQQLLQVLRIYLIDPPACPAAPPAPLQVREDAQQLLQVLSIRHWGGDSAAIGTATALGSSVQGAAAAAASVVAELPSAVLVVGGLQEAYHTHQLQVSVQFAR